MDELPPDARDGVASALDRGTYRAFVRASGNCTLRVEPPDSVQESDADHC